MELGRGTDAAARWLLRGWTVAYVRATTSFFCERTAATPPAVARPRMFREQRRARHFLHAKQQHPQRLCVARPCVAITMRDRRLISRTTNPMALPRRHDSGFLATTGCDIAYFRKLRPRYIIAAVLTTWTSLSSRCGAPLYRHHGARQAPALQSHKHNISTSPTRLGSWPRPVVTSHHLRKLRYARYIMAAVLRTWTSCLKSVRRAPISMPAAPRLPAAQRHKHKGDLPRPHDTTNYARCRPGHLSRATAPSGITCPHPLHNWHRGTQHGPLAAISPPECGARDRHTTSWRHTLLRFRYPFPGGPTLQLAWRHSATWADFSGSGVAYRQGK